MCPVDDCRFGTHDKRRLRKHFASEKHSVKALLENGIDVWRVKKISKQTSFEILEWLVNEEYVVV